MDGTDRTDHTPLTVTTTRAPAVLTIVIFILDVVSHLKIIAIPDVEVSKP